MKYRPALPMARMANKTPKQKQLRYTVLGGMDDPLLSSSFMQEVVNIHMEYPDMKVERLYKFKLSTFPSEEAPKGENNCML